MSYQPFSFTIQSACPICSSFNLILLSSPPQMTARKVRWRFLFVPMFLVQCTVFSVFVWLFPWFLPLFSANSSPPMSPGAFQTLWVGQESNHVALFPTISSNAEKETPLKQQWQEDSLTFLASCLALYFQMHLQSTLVIPCDIWGWS